MAQVCLVCISTSKVFELALFSKVTRVDKAMIVANDTSLRGAILVLFLEFRPGHRAEICQNRPQNLSR